MIIYRRTARRLRSLLNGASSPESRLVGASGNAHPKPDRLALNCEGSLLLIPGAQAPHEGVRALPFAAEASVRPAPLHKKGDFSAHTSLRSLREKTTLQWPRGVCHHGFVELLAREWPTDHLASSRQQHREVG